MKASECYRNYAKIMNDPCASDADRSYAIEAWANVVLDFFGSNGGGEDAPSYIEYMHRTGIRACNDDKELAEFYEEMRWSEEYEQSY